MDVDAVIHNGTLVTVDDRMRIIDNGWIGIHEGVIRTIEATAPDSPPPTAKMTIDAAGGIVMPGLVNTHTHLPMTLFRGLADDLPLMDWLNDAHLPGRGPLHQSRNGALGHAARLRGDAAVRHHLLLRRLFPRRRGGPGRR